MFCCVLCVLSSFSPLLSVFLFLHPSSAHSNPVRFFWLATVPSSNRFVQRGGSGLFDLILTAETLYTVEVADKVCEYVSAWLTNDNDVARLWGVLSGHE